MDTVTTDIKIHEQTTLVKDIIDITQLGVTWTEGLYCKLFLKRIDVLKTDHRCMWRQRGERPCAGSAPAGGALLRRYFRLIHMELNVSKFLNKS